MKVTVERAELLKSLGHVQSVVERRNTIPILSNVKLEATKGGTTFTATDMDIAVVEELNGTVKEPGAATVPAHMFYDIVRKLPDGAEVELSGGEEAGKLEIRAGKAKFSLSCLPVKDFPVMAEGEFTHNFTLSSAEMLELIDKTRFAVSTEETRYYLNGIYLHIAGKDKAQTLRAVATDGHRLARTEVAVPAGAEGMPGVIIPRKTVGELKKLVDEVDGEIQVSLSESKIRFSCGRAVLVSKLIDGTFPDYERVIPSGNDKLMELNGKQFAQAVDLVSTISSDRSSAVKLSLKNGNLMLAADNDNGDAHETIEVNYAADPIEIGFNSRYLLEMMSQVDGDTVQFVLSDGSSPALVRDTADAGALYVIMPMRI
ncbi:MAG: DNA polymerase III subunit beta [Alphaproteobacteria bacterium]|nr:DNA polymerase III subunit beta [Alphaproteobacteria bacterium]